MNKFQVVNLEQIQEKILARIENAKENYEKINVILEIAKQFDGKPISKRLFTAVKKHPRFANENIFWSEEYTMFQIKSFGNKDYFTVLIGYKGEKTISYDRVKEHNRGYLREDERAKQYEEKFKDLPKLVEKWNSMVNQLDALESELDNMDFGYFFRN